MNYKTILIYSFALFAMFFGSGNLVFPIKIGQLTAQYWLYGFLGLFLTGILLPFLGLFVVKLHNGSYISFFAEAGSFAKVILPLFTLSLLGAFGVVPRCITVAYGSIVYSFPSLSLKSFSLIFCAIMYYCCLKEKRIINILGKWLSPILVATLAWLIAAGVFYPYSPNIQDIKPLNAVYEGFITGYQTMDLFAAFFFSALTFRQIQQSLPTTTSPKDLIKFAATPSIIGAGLLTLVYLGFVYLGAHFRNLIATCEPEFMLPTIANHVLGKKAAIIIGIAVIFSCFTTAITLNNIYAKYLSSCIKVKLNLFPIILLITTITSFYISLFDFNGIAKFLGLMLKITYPSVIILTISSIITNRFKYLKIVLFYGALFSMILFL